MTINRLCASGLQAIAMAAERIMTGAVEVIIAGGAESMSMVPMTGNKLSPNPYLSSCYPDVYLNWGLTAENLASKYGISRHDADSFAVASHHKALTAVREGKFRKEIVPLEVGKTNFQTGENSSSYRIEKKKIIFETDEGPRAESSVEALGKLKPVFSTKGVSTAGNASQVSDGAAASLVMSAERAKLLGFQPLARFIAFSTAGVAPEIMGIGPVLAIPKVLSRAALKLEDIDLIELNEAFAVQALAVIQEAGLDPNKVNVNGGAIALGHPLGCTGAKLTTTLLSEMERRQARYGMVTMCVGGGMGAAGIFERIN